MLQIKLYKSEIDMEIREFVSNDFDHEIVFYMLDKRDSIPFFLSIIKVDAKNRKLVFLKTFSKENENLLEKYDGKEAFVLRRTPHRSMLIQRGKDFYTFVQDERYFFYVNEEEMYIKVYTLDELINESGYVIKKISASIYRDYNDASYMYISAIDDKNYLHIYRASMDLADIREIYKEANHNVPPHSIINYKNLLFLSHDFGNANFINLDNGKIENSDNIIKRLELKKIKYKLLNGNRDVSDKEAKKEIVREFLNDGKYATAKGEVSTINLNNLKESLYYTSGASPAHFEIDSNEDEIYIVSHNFFGWDSDNIFIKPAVIDKFKIVDDELVQQKSFAYKKGFRYTSHKLFYYKGKPYLCTFAQPNRLLIIDAKRMELESFTDIGADELSAKDDVRDFLNNREPGNEIVAMEISHSGRFIMFMDNINIYYYDMENKNIAEKYKYNEEEGNLKIRTAHVDYLNK